MSTSIITTRVRKGDNLLGTLKKVASRQDDIDERLLQEFSRNALVPRTEHEVKDDIYYFQQGIAATDPLKVNAFCTCEEADLDFDTLSNNGECLASCFHSCHTLS